MSKVYFNFTTLPHYISTQGLFLWQLPKHRTTLSLHTAWRIGCFPWNEIATVRYAWMLDTICLNVNFWNGDFTTILYNCRTSSKRIILRMLYCFHYSLISRIEKEHNEIWVVFTRRACRSLTAVFCRWIWQLLSILFFCLTNFLVSLLQPH